MNNIQETIFIGSREESGIWEILNDIANCMAVSREKAFSLLQNEMGFLMARGDIFLIKSERLYESDGANVLELKTLANLSLDDVEFKKEGPFYYLSNVPTI